MVEETLKASPLFKDFSPTGLQILATIAQEKSFARGTPLFAENMVGEGLFLIAEGKVAIGLKGGDGKEQHLGTLGKGDYLGELSLLNASARMVSAMAESDVRAVEIRSDAFKKLMAQKPQACLKLMLNISAEFGKKLAANREGIRAMALANKG